jgi:nitrogen regulatory protein P-II 1
MKLIKAYVRTFMLSRVLDALRDLKVPRVTVIDVKALGDEVSHEQLEISAELGCTYTTMSKIELVCDDECVEKLKKAILAVARTGHKGDGIVAVSPVEEAISIRSGERIGQQ